MANENVTNSNTPKENTPGKNVVKEIFSKVISFFKSQKLRDFFLGRYYPVFVVAMTFLSHITSFEWFFCAIILISAFYALLAYDSMVPLITPACCLAMHIARVNAAVNPASPDYYFSGAGLFASIPMIAFIVIAFGAFFFLRWKKGRIKFRKLPLLLPALLLSLAFLLNGVFAEGYTVKNLAIGAFEVLTVFFFFYVFYIGLSGENYADLIERFCFISALLALLISAEIGWLYLTDEFILASGSIDKHYIVFGWGVSNTAGSMLGVLVPVCFLGLMKAKKHAWMYLAAASIAYVSSIFTLSRNALLVVTGAYIVSIGVAMFFGNFKRFARIAFPILVAAVVILVVLFWDEIKVVFADYFNKGMSDNGRYPLWRMAIPAFLSAPIFGVGLFGLEYSSAMTAIIPGMLHCTPLQLISTMGLFGLLSYGYYRVMTIIRVLRRPSLIKTMLGGAVLVILLGSLLDNFIFYMQQMIYPSIALALIYLADEEKEKA